MKKPFAKKGQVYMALLVILTLLICGSLFVLLLQKQKGFPREIGERQFAVRAAVQQGEKALLYVDVAAGYAYDTALLELGKHWYAADCPTYRGVPVVYGAEDCMAYDTDVRSDLKKALESQISIYFNDAMNNYLYRYEDVALVQNNYLLFFQERTVVGTALETIEIPIISATSAEVDATYMYATASYVPGENMFDIWPVVYDEQMITSCFGHREAVKSGTRTGSTNHAGIDMRGPTGTPVVAVASGIVTVSDPYEWGRVVIDHGTGVLTEYVHMDTVLVAVGDTVAAEEQIGTTGTRAPSGEYEPHLHFGVIDTHITPASRDKKGNTITINDWGVDHVNALCYLSDSLEFVFKHGESTSGCNTDGGAYKFCEAYKKQTTILTTYSYTPSTSTKEMLQEIDANYGAIIEKAIQGTDIEKSLVIALIAQESRGNPNAGSETGALGLMQFTKSTGHQYGLCDNDSCSGRDERSDPEKAIPAGVKLLAHTIHYFSETDNIRLGLAAYNGGAAVITAAIEATGKSDPVWEEVSAALTEEMIADVYQKAYNSETYNKYFRTAEQRKSKVTQIQDYVTDVLDYAYAYEELEKEVM